MDKPVFFIIDDRIGDAEICNIVAEKMAYDLPGVEVILMHPNKVEETLVKTSGRIIGALVDCFTGEEFTGLELAKRLLIPGVLAPGSTEKEIKLFTSVGKDRRNRAEREAGTLGIELIDKTNSVRLFALANEVQNKIKNTTSQA